jgi:hypothetical protein
MADSFPSFDLNVRLEEDDDGNLPIDLNEPILEDHNNGNVPFSVCSFSLILIAAAFKLVFLLSLFFRFQQDFI